MKSNGSLYYGHRYPREIIGHAIWLYYRFGIGFRDVEDLPEAGTKRIDRLPLAEFPPHPAHRRGCTRGESTIGVGVSPNSNPAHPA